MHVCIIAITQYELGTPSIVAVYFPAEDHSLTKKEGLQMGTLKHLIEDAQHSDQEATLKLVQLFLPCIKKYTRWMNYDEDFKSDMTLALIELIQSIKLEKLKNSSDQVLIAYVSKSLYHQYIILSQNKKSLISHETSIDEIQAYSLPLAHSTPTTYEEIELKHILSKALTKKECFCVTKIVVEGYSAAEIATYLGISKQAVNQCKQRALCKLKFQLAV